MRHGKAVLLLVILFMTAFEAYAAGACGPGRYPPKCYPCLGCEPCNDGSGQYCDTVWSRQMIGVERGTEELELDSELLPGGTLELTSTTIEGEYRWDGFSRSFFVAPFVRAGVGAGEAELDGGPGDDGTLLSIGGGFESGRPTSRWRSRLEYRYRTLDRVDGARDIGLFGVDSFDLRTHKAELSFRYLAIPDRLHAIIGVRGTHASSEIHATFEERSIAESVTARKLELVAGAEVQFGSRMTGRVELSSDGDSTQSRVGIGYRFGGARRISPATIAPGRQVDMGCVPRAGFSCREPGFRCLVMFPEDEWPDFRRMYGDLTVAFNGTAEVLPGESPKLRYQFDQPYPNEVTTLPLEEKKALSCELANSLGYDQVTILAGNYAILPTLGEFGGVEFDVEVDGGGPDAIRPYEEFKECVGFYWFAPGLNVVFCGLGTLLVPASH